MDPNTTLRDIRQMVRSIATSRSTDHLLDLGAELASAITQLDEWLSSGGYAPADWCADPVAKISANALADKD